MRTQSSRVKRAAAAVLSLGAIVAVACRLPSLCFGQEPARTGPGSPPDSTTRPEAVVEKKRVPPTGNPLQVRPGGGNGDLTQTELSHDFNDYRHLDSGPKKSAGQGLPLFGYDIFKYARDINDAQRKMIAQQAISEFTPQSRPRARSNSDNTSGDLPSSGDPTRTQRRPATRRSTDPTDAGTSPRRESDQQGDETGSDGSDSSSDTSAPPRRRTTQGRTQSSGSSQSGNYDNSLDSQTSRSRSGLDEEPTSDFGTPSGPISMLYRAVNATVPDNYTLSAGDVLKITVDSPTVEAQTVKRTVDSRGQVKLDLVGNVVVRGNTIADAEKLLERRLRPYIKNAHVSIETGLLHTISVLVAGSAYVPGTYNLLATATAFNLLNIAGGPSDEGSLRAIQVRRRGETVATLDIYKMITGDAKWADVQLAAGDTLLIPSRKSRVTMTGEVLHPAIFELLPGETLRDAIAYAGGIKATGLGQSVRVNTVVPGSERVIKDLDLKGPEIDKLTLYDGDQIEVFSVRNRLNNRVTIEGAVDQPNDYQLLPGMRVADLVEHARGPLTEAYLSKAELHRWRPDNTDELIVVDLEKALAHDPKDNLILQKWDRLKVYTRDEVAWTGRRRVEVEGAVKNPGTYDASKNMKVSDLLRMAGGPTPDAEMEKAHLFHHHDNAPYTHEYVNVAAAVKGDANSDPEVFDSDRLVLYNVEQASFTPDHRVDIRGEVVNPGRYPRYQGMKVSDLVAFAGGFKPSAANQVVLAHARRIADAPNTKVVTINFDKAGRCAAADDVTLEDGDVVSIQGVGGYQPEVQSFTVRGAVNKPGVIFLKSKDMRLSDAIREAGGLRPEAFPDGAEFYRDPQMLATTGQRSLVQSLSSLNDLLNDSETKREMAKAQIELIRATGAAVSDSVGLGGLAGGAAAAIPNPAAAGAGAINGSQLVSKPRVLGTGQLDPNRYVAVDLRGALARPKGVSDIILVDGDEISVPETPTTLSIVGAVNSPRGVLYDPGKKLDYYVALAGGLTLDAAKDRIQIFHLGGGVIPANRARELKPGDVVFVPTRVLAAKLGSKSNPVDSFFKSLTSSAIVFKLATSLFGL